MAAVRGAKALVPMQSCEEMTAGCGVSNFRCCEDGSGRRVE
jgi:hypothetical protein